MSVFRLRYRRELTNFKPILMEHVIFFMVTKMKLTANEILEDLHAAENDCQLFEKKYGILSEYFYAAYMNGSLEDNGNPDFALWAGSYEVKLDRERSSLTKSFEQGVNQNGNDSQLSPGLA